MSEPDWADKLARAIEADIDRDFADLRAVETRAWNEAIEAAAKKANAMPTEYEHDGVSMHVENITCARCAAAIRSLRKEQP